MGEVTVQLEDGGRKVVGRGASTDIIEASAKAYIDGLNKLASLDPPPGALPPRVGSAAGASMAVFLLARFDSHRQTILPGRQRAGNKRRERAGRIVGPVEVQYDRTVMGQLDIQEPAAAIGFPTGGRIAENEQEDLGIGLFQNRIQPQLTAQAGGIRGIPGRPNPRFAGEPGRIGP